VAEDTDAAGTAKKQRTDEAAADHPSQENTDSTEFLTEACFADEAGVGPLTLRHLHVPPLALLPFFIFFIDLFIYIPGGRLQAYDPRPARLPASPSSRCRSPTHARPHDRTTHATRAHARRPWSDQDRLITTTTSCREGRAGGGQDGDGQDPGLPGARRRAVAPGRRRSRTARHQRPHHLPHSRAWSAPSRCRVSCVVCRVCGYCVVVGTKDRSTLQRCRP
jgi:hypothetical protein